MMTKESSHNGGWWGLLAAMHGHVTCYVAEAQSGDSDASDFMLRQTVRPTPPWRRPSPREPPLNSILPLMNRPRYKNIAVRSCLRKDNMIHDK